MSIENRLIQLFEKDPKRTYKPKQLAQLFKIPDDKYPAFRRKLNKMVNEGKLTRFQKGRIGQGMKSAEVVGKLHVKTQGYGFIVTDEKSIDVFISQKNMGTALHGDIVRARLFAHLKGKSQEARVIEVIERARSNFVGVFRPGPYWGVVVPDELKIHRDLYIAPENQMSAKDGQKVVAQLTEWTDERQNPQGEIVEILGYPDEPGVDVISIARSFDLPDQFPKAVENEAQKFSEEIPKEEIEKRLDWRQELTFTIDPNDSKDFDDAISLKKLNNGNFLLGVHIADVSHFVPKNSKLDQESQNRGTSVYLVDRVIPMFPEKLSNEICSLKPGQEKLTFSVLIELNKAADVLNYQIKESVIISDRRFTYEEVQDILDNKTADNKFSQVLQQMLELNKQLIRKRKERGSLDFSSQEVKVILNEKFVPVEIEKRLQIDSHRIIEEFMVLANSVVAKHVDLILKEKTGQDLPFPYRIHERPSKEKLQEFKNFLNALGIEFNIRKKVTPKMFQRLQSSIRDTEKQVLIERVMVRSMMKAKYTTENQGHFGLALKYYCHFTSPIRRYPDLLVHRMLKAYLADPSHVPLKKQKLEKMCEHATKMEIRAMEAERASTKAKQLEFMQDKIGETFRGIISGVTSFGIFVEIIDYLVEGLVHITALDDDYYNYDETRYRLIGTYQGKTYQLGDAVTVKVVLVNVEERIIDFELVNETE